MSQVAPKAHCRHEQSAVQMFDACLRHQRKVMGSLINTGVDRGQDVHEIHFLMNHDTS
jgi:hypothetical protein